MNEIYFCMNPKEFNSLRQSKTGRFPSVQAKVMQIVIPVGAETWASGG